MELQKAEVGVGVDRRAVVAAVGSPSAVARSVALHVVVVRVAVVPAVLFRRERATGVVVAASIMTVVTPLSSEVPAPVSGFVTELEPRGLLAAVVVPGNSSPRLRRDRT